MGNSCYRLAVCSQPVYIYIYGDHAIEIAWCLKSNEHEIPPEFKAFFWKEICNDYHH